MDKDKIAEIRENETRTRYIGRMVKNGFEKDDAEDLWKLQTEVDLSECESCGA